MITTEARKKWIQTLKFGEYIQTQGYLHRTDDKGLKREGYCCLGVACDLFAEELGLNREDMGSTEYFDGDRYFLPPKVVKLLDLRSSDGMSHYNSLVSLNDNGKSFKEIAEALETGIYWK